MTYNLNGNHWANSENMGKKLLVKAGWSSGEGVGKDKQGTNVHIKVSIKNEKQGIGMKADNRQSCANLLQCTEFDLLLKTKYAKTTESDAAPAASERSMSRSRFGRAVPRDFFNPVDGNQWNRILCSSDSAQPNQCKTEPSVNEFSKSDQIYSNANFTSPKTIYEYFTTKMAGNNGATRIGSLHEFLRARDEKRNLETNKPTYDQKISDEPEEVSQKKSKTKISSNETTDPVIISIEIAVGEDRRKSKKQKTQTEDVEKVVEIEKEEQVKRKKEQKQRKTKDVPVMVVDEDTDLINEKRNRKRKTNHNEDESETKTKRKKHEAFTDETVHEVDIETDGEQKKKKRKREHQKSKEADFKTEDKSTLVEDTENDRKRIKSNDTKRDEFEGVMKIEKKKSKKQKNRNSCHEEHRIQEQLDITQTKFEVELEESVLRESQSKRKSKTIDNSTTFDIDVEKRVDNTNEDLKASDSIETTQGTDNIESGNKPCKSLLSQLPSVRKSVLAELSELVETPVIDPWTTSCIDTIAGYRYY